MGVGGGFQLEQLMELAGLSVASAAQVGKLGLWENLFDLLLQCCFVGSNNVLVSLSLSSSFVIALQNIWNPTLQTCH